MGKKILKTIKSEGKIKPSGDGFKEKAYFLNLIRFHVVVDVHV